MKKPHNPDSLTEDQVNPITPIYRLLDEDEVKKGFHAIVPDLQRWEFEAWAKSGRLSGADAEYTYRTTLSREALRAARGLPPEAPKEEVRPSVRYKEITPLEAIQALAAAGGPIDEGYVFRDAYSGEWIKDKLCGADLVANNYQFMAEEVSYRNCARIIPTLLSPEQCAAVKTLWPEAKYVAMDKNGKAYSYSVKPSVQEWSEQWIYSGGSHRPIGLDGYVQQDKFRDSLVEL